MAVHITDFKTLGKIIVHDDNEEYPRTVLAMARKTAIGPWILRLYGASWADTMVNPDKLSQQRRMRIKPGTHAYLKTVNTKPEALEHMQAVAKLVAGTMPAVTKR